VGADGVTVASPAFDNDLRFLQRVEDLPVKQLRSNIIIRERDVQNSYRNMSHCDERLFVRKYSKGFKNIRKDALSRAKLHRHFASDYSLGRDRATAKMVPTFDEQEET
jgi:hypothetical protein